MSQSALRHDVECDTNNFHSSNKTTDQNNHLDSNNSTPSNRRSNSQIRIDNKRSLNNSVELEIIRQDKKQNFPEISQNQTDGSHIKKQQTSSAEDEIRNNELFSIISNFDEDFESDIKSVKSVLLKLQSFVSDLFYFTFKH